MSIEVANPQPHNIHALKRIWEDCFGDTNEYIDFFFENCYKPEQTLVAYYDLKPGGMLFMLPSKLTINNKVYNGSYIYAVATKPSFQGKGIMKKLESEAVRISKEKSLDFLCLVPQSESLFKMYGKIGYKTTFYLGEKTYIPFSNREEEITFEDCLQEEYIKMRSDYLLKMPSSLDFIQPLDEYRFMEQKKVGVDIKKIVFGENQFFYTGYKKSSEFIIKETSLEEDLLKKVICVIAKEQAVERVVVKGLRGNISKIAPYGMYKGLTQESDNCFVKSQNPYMNMMLD